MKQALFHLMENQGDLNWEQILTRICVSALLGILIFVSYYISHRGTIYSRKFNVSLTMLTVLTGTVMVVIGNNIALSLGMVGALSIVRFRTAIKDSRDTLYIFWAIIVGICCGVANYFVAAIGSAVVFVILFFFGAVKNDSRMLIILRGRRTCELPVESLVFKLFQSKARLRVKNTMPDSIELIYEITEQQYRKAQKQNSDMVDAFYAIDGMEYINFVIQNDEIAN